MCVSSFLFVLPSRWENITGTHTTFSTSSIEMDTHPHNEILGKLSKPEDALKSHKVLPWFTYISTLQHHISAMLACFSPLLCKQTKLSFPRCLPVLMKLSQEGLMWRTIWRSGELFLQLSNLAAGGTAVRRKRMESRQADKVSRGL